MDNWGKHSMSHNMHVYRSMLSELHQTIAIHALKATVVIVSMFACSALSISEFCACFGHTLSI